MSGVHRTALRFPVTFSGIGLHSGQASTVRILPAAPGSGISFCRIDIAGFHPVSALWDRVGALELCTTLGQGGADGISTVEHLMAALCALGVDDALVEVDGAEIPILDGSSAPFSRGLMAAGLRVSSTVRRSIRVIRPVEVRDGDRMACLEPHEGFAVDCTIDFRHPAIGRSTYRAEIDPALFLRDVAPARTFALQSDVARMRSAGLALGGSLDNAVVVGADGVLNPGGLRFRDEFARHKALDAIGDLYMAGAPILGRYVSMRAGHAMNNALVRTLMEQPSSWRWERTISQSPESMRKRAA